MPRWVGFSGTDKILTYRLTASSPPAANCCWNTWHLFLSCNRQFSFGSISVSRFWIAAGRYDNGLWKSHTASCIRPWPIRWLPWFARFLASLASTASTSTLVLAYLASAPAVYVVSRLAPVSPVVYVSKKTNNRKWSLEYGPDLDQLLHKITHRICDDSPIKQNILIRLITFNWVIVMICLISIPIFVVIVVNERFFKCLKNACKSWSLPFRFGVYVFKLCVLFLFSQHFRAVALYQYYPKTICQLVLGSLGVVINTRTPAHLPPNLIWTKLWTRGACGLRMFRISRTGLCGCAQRQSRRKSIADEREGSRFSLGVLYAWWPLKHKWPFGR